MATRSKPSQKHETSSWRANLDELCEAARLDCSQYANAARQSAASTRIDTDWRAKWSQHRSNNLLAERIRDVRALRHRLDHVKAELDAEIDRLAGVKRESEATLDDVIQVNVAATNECLNEREERHAAEDVVDDVQNGLRAEQTLVGGVIQRLQTEVTRAFDQLVQLQQVRDKFLPDLQDKLDTICLDVAVYNENEHSNGVGHKPAAQSTQIPKDASVPSSWLDFSNDIIMEGEFELGNSATLRNQMEQRRNECLDQLEHQRDLVEHALRNRINELESAIDRLKYEKERVDEEKQKLLKDIKSTEEALRAKEPTLKLAETRLAQRNARPGIDLCHDAAQQSFIAEVDELRASKQSLAEQLANLRDALHRVEERTHELDADLKDKQAALVKDRMCVQIRQKLRTKPSTRSERTMLPEGVVRARSQVIR